MAVRVGKPPGRYKVPISSGEPWLPTDPQVVAKLFRELPVMAKHGPVCTLNINKTWRYDRSEGADRSDGWWFVDGHITTDRLDVFVDWLNANYWPHIRIGVVTETIRHDEGSVQYRDILVTEQGVVGYVDEVGVSG